MQTIYIVMTENRFIMGAFASKGDAQAVVDEFKGEGVHIKESILYPESWREGNP